MKLKIEGDSALYKALLELYERGEDCHKQATRWVVSTFKRKLYFVPPKGVIFGGVGAVHFKHAHGGWALVDAKRKLYAPKHKSYVESAARLPVVTKQELKDLLHYGNYPCAEGINTVPTVTRGPEYFLLSVPDDVRGYVWSGLAMSEILGSEYNSLRDLAESFNASRR